MTRQSITRLLALAALATGSGAAAQGVDTSDWNCQFCPFEYGYDGDYTVGATSVSEDSAYFGDATGYDEDGVYGNLDGDGSYSTEGGYRMRWAFEDLGLDSRAIALEGGNQGRWDYNVGYRELPRREFFTTRSVFIQSGPDTLTLPAGWVRAPTTSGLTALDASLVDTSIESDRTILGAGGRILLGENFSVAADYRRQEQDGLNIYGGASFTNAALLPMPFDYVTDEVDFTLRYGGDNGYLSLGWYLSDFENENTALTWSQPFTTLPGADVAALAQAPDSQFTQVSLSGGFAVPTAKTSISASAAIGEIEQDTRFPAYTTNTLLTPDALPRANLAGSVDTVNYAFALTTRAIRNARIRFTYRYDERDNQTAQAQWNRVIVDALVSNDPEMNIPYSFERSVLDLSGDYRVWDNLRLSAGYKRRQIDRDFQEVAEQTEDTGWGALRWQLLDSFGIDLKGGGSRRENDRYDESVATSLGQNPLLRKYNLAFRQRDFGELQLNWTPGFAPLSAGLTAMYADDSYTRSRLGITDGQELLVSLDLGWTVSETSSLYANVGFDEIESRQAGSENFATPDWSATHEDSFTSFGFGLRIADVGDQVDLEFDFLRSDGTSEIRVDDAGGPSAFPDLETQLDHFRFGVTWNRSERLAFVADLRWQRFESDDWAIEGVMPETIPVILSLGAEPYDEDVLIAGVGFRYSLGSGSD